MSDEIAATRRAMNLRASALTEDVHPAERSFRGYAKEFLWVLLASVVGVVAAFLAAVILMIIAVIVALIALKGQYQVITDTMTRLQESGTPETLGAAIGLILAVAVVNGVAFLVFIVIASLIRRQKIWRSFTSARRFRWRQLAVGFLLYAALLGGFLGIETAMGAETLEMPLLDLTDSALEIALFVIVCVVGFVVAAGAEEFLFRGWLLRQTSAFTRNPWVLLLLNGVLFSAFHLDPDPNAFVARTVMGVAFGFMALRLGGIEFATGAHAANNILLVLFVEPLPIVPPPPEPFQAHYLLESAFLLAAGVIITEAAVRIPALRSMMGLDREGPPKDVIFR